ncbi:MAG: hypothetical protein K2M03_03500, partial [Muribaculaceae bacterium]|nr:hypothetical protein [Muribaculaceae bacterium]
MKKFLLMLAGSLLGTAGVMAASPDLAKARYTVGEGSNTYLLVLRFNVPERMDNFVYAVKSDNDDLTALDALNLVSGIDSRLKVDMQDGQPTISIDLNGDSQIDKADIQDVKLSDAATTTEVATDGVTKVLTLSQDGDNASASPYYFYIPGPDEDGVWLPEEMTVKLSDNTPVIPCFVQV